MNIKRLVFVVLMALFLTGCIGSPEAIATSSAVQLPEAISLAIGTYILVALAAGFVYIFEKTGLDLRGYAVALSVTLSAFVTAQVQGWINAIPLEYDPLLTVVLNIIVVIIGGLGTLRLISKQPKTLIAK